MNTLAGRAALFALIAAVYPTLASAGADQDPDIPRSAQSGVSKEEFMLRRAEAIALLRGIQQGEAFDPSPNNIDARERRESRRGPDSWWG